MADAWENLIEGSTLPVAPGNDAWDHLLAQGGAGIPGEGVDRYVLANITVVADYAEEDIALAAAVIGGTLQAGGDIAVDITVEDIQPAIIIDVDLLDIDNPDEIEV